jgi:SAM-dependent methyltransferase
MNEPNKDQARERVRAFARESLARGDALGWFDAFYREVGGDEAAIPWADLQGHPLLVEWLEKSRTVGAGRRALVIGCGLGEDCEALGRAGFEVTGFDLSPTAIEWCRKRFPASRTTYVTADLLAPPREWHRAFEFVFECYTLQALPPELRFEALPNIADLVAKDGELLVVTRARDPHEDVGQLPWPLMRSELMAFNALALRELSFEDLPAVGNPPSRHFRALYRGL